MTRLEKKVGWKQKWSSPRIACKISFGVGVKVWTGPSLRSHTRGCTLLRLAKHQLHFASRRTARFPFLLILIITSATLSDGHVGTGSCHGWRWRGSGSKLSQKLATSAIKSSLFPTLSVCWQSVSCFGCPPASAPSRGDPVRLSDLASRYVSSRYVMTLSCSSLWACACAWEEYIK